MSVYSVLKKWYTVEEINASYWPYQFEFESWYQVPDAERFCYGNFKSKNWRNRGRTFAFKHKQDYEWFLLRWQ